MSASVVLMFRAATLADLDALADMERRHYPEDEAASRDRIQFRIEKAADFFLIAETISPVEAKDNNVDDDGDAPMERRMVGFVNGTLSLLDVLDHDSMGGHEPNGHNLCIHSVVVDKSHWRRGIGVRMLEAYVDVVRRYREQRRGAKQTPLPTKISLIAKQHLATAFYPKAGFVKLRDSPVVYGKDKWVELYMDLTLPIASGVMPSIEDDLAEYGSAAAASSAAAVSSASKTVDDDTH